MVFQFLLRLPRASKLWTKWLLLSLIDNKVMCSVFTSREMETNHSPVFLPRLFTVLIRLFGLLALLPQVSWQGVGGKGQSDLRLFKPTQPGFLQIQEAAYLPTAVKGKHFQGCDLLTLGAAQTCASPFVFPGKSEWGFHSSGRISKFILFFDFKSFQRVWMHEWVTNVVFHLIYWNCPNSPVSPGESL